MPGKLLKTRIRNNIALVEAPASANHIFEYDKSSKLNPFTANWLWCITNTESCYRR